jgi:hypothetical protein
MTPGRILVADGQRELPARIPKLLGFLSCPVWNVGADVIPAFAPSGPLANAV